MDPLAPLLSVRNLSCERQDRLLFDDLGFQLAAGEILQIAGANGSGKTTLLRILCGLSLITDGEVLWRGQPLDECFSEFTQNMLYIGHKPGNKAELTPFENLEVFARNRVRLSDESIDIALSRVGLGGFEDTPCHSLSMGQQRRVALARLYLFHAGLWILDEPFVSLDRKAVGGLEKRIAEQVNQGGSCILSTHHVLSLDVPVKQVVLGEI